MLLFQAAGAASEPVIDESGPQSTANIARAHGKIGYASTASLHATGQRAARLACKLAPQQLSNIMQEIGTGMLVDAPLIYAMGEASVRLISEFAPQNLSNTVQELGTLLEKHGGSTSACIAQSLQTLQGFGQQEPTNAA